MFQYQMAKTAEPNWLKLGIAYRLLFVRVPERSCALKLFNLSLDIIYFNLKWLDFYILCKLKYCMSLIWINTISTSLNRSISNPALHRLCKGQLFMLRQGLLIYFFFWINKRNLFFSLFFLSKLIHCVRSDADLVGAHLKLLVQRDVASIIMS